MAKNKKARDVLSAIRRNTGYAAGRSFALVSSVVTIVACAGLGAYFGTGREQQVMLVFILTGAIGGVVPALLINHLANAIFDGADSLIQIAKFQERSLRHRGDALDLVEKIRSEVEEEAPEAQGPSSEPENSPPSPPPPTAKEEGEKNEC